VVFLIDANGILNVTRHGAQEPEGCRDRSEADLRLSEADVERMVEESFTYAEADVEARLLIETRNEAETVITHVERALAQGRQLIGDEEHRTSRRRWRR